MTRITGALFTAPPPNQKKRGVQGIKDATESKNVKLDQNDCITEYGNGKVMKPAESPEE